MMSITDYERGELLRKITNKINKDFITNERSKFVVMRDTKDNQFLLVDYSVLEKERNENRKVILLVDEKRSFWKLEKIDTYYVYLRYLILI